MLDVIPDNPLTAYLGSLLWAPYSSDKLFFSTAESYDSAGKKLFVQNGYLYTISSNEIQRITPKMFGTYGPSQLQFGTWLNGSRDGLDSLLYDSNIYVPQEDRMYPIPDGYNEDVWQSPTTPDLITYKYKGVPNLKHPQLFLNGTKFLECDNIDEWDNGPHWSPDGKHLSLSVLSNFPTTNPNDPYTYDEIWIVDVPLFNLLPNSGLAMYRINMQQQFCMYSFNGIYAEFVTDSTLAVSMGKDGDKLCPIWEISLKGKLLRQLTH